MKKLMLFFSVVFAVVIFSSCRSYAKVEKVSGDYFTDSEGVLKFLELDDDKEIVDIIYHNSYTNILFVHVIEAGKDYIYVAEGPNNNVKVTKISDFSLEDKGAGDLMPVYKFNFRNSTNDENGRYYELWMRGDYVVVMTNHGRSMAEYKFHK